MNLEPSQIIENAAEQVLVNGELIRSLLTRLYLDYPQFVPDKWEEIGTFLAAAGGLESGQISVFLGFLKELSDDEAAADPRIVLDEVDLRAYCRPVAEESGAPKEPEPAEAAKTQPEWIEPGSRIYRSGASFFLDTGEELWQVGEGASSYFYDRSRNTYDRLGKTLAASPAQTAHADDGLSDDDRAEQIAQTVAPLLAEVLGSVPHAQLLSDDEVSAIMREVLAGIIR